eukprot:1242947-Pyramimonas_sp.AAC.1
MHAFTRSPACDHGYGSLSAEDARAHAPRWQRKLTQLLILYTYTPECTHSAVSMPSCPPSARAGPDFYLPSFLLTY